MSVPLTDAERVDARRFMGYPAYGPGNSGFQGWRFFDAYGTLEFRLTNASDAELVVIRQYLVSLTSLEQDILNATSKIGIDQAAVFKRNANEIRDRQRLLDDWRRRFCGFLGIPAGEALTGGGGNMQVII